VNGTRRIRGRTAVASAVALGAGIAIATLDSRPGYDDTGVTAVLLMISTAVATVIARRWPLVWALLVGLWTPFVEIISVGNVGSIGALAFAAIGAVAGWGMLARSSERTP
jgi:hypothetical protein